jgi:hypothetical protein
LSREAVGSRLFAISEPYIPYPAAQNTHRYEDVHRELYGALIDGMQTDAIELLGGRLGPPINTQNSRTRDALAKIMTAASDPVFEDAFENVSAQRRLASHNARPPAKAVNAFERFTDDLRACHAALHRLRTALYAPGAASAVDLAAKS